MIYNNFEVYVFDLDNTLYPENSFVKQSLTSFLTEIDIPSESIAEVQEALAHKFVNSIDTPPIQIAEEVLKGTKIDLAKYQEYLRYKTYYLNIELDGLALLSLRVLARSKKKIWVWTNGNQNQQMKKLEALSHQFNFGNRVIFCDLFAPKPSPVTLQLISQLENVSLEKMLVVGDHPIDAASALNAGVPFSFSNVFFKYFSNYLQVE